MKNENIIIAIVFLVIVALFAFNFTKMTGFAPKSIIAPTITLSPTILGAGNLLNITIKINDGCVDPKFYIYLFRNNMVGTRKATKVFSPDIGDCARVSSKGAKIPCGSFKYCKSDLKEDMIKTTIKTYDDWNGYYVLRVYYYDGQEKKSIDTKFRIL